MRRAPIMDTVLETEAGNVMARHGITLEANTFKMPKTGSRFSWDTHYTFRFFSSPNRLNGSCAVIELQQCYAPRIDVTFPGVTVEEWTTLFRYQVFTILRYAHRRMALATLINSQREVVPFLQATGFEKVSTGFGGM